MSIFLADCIVPPAATGLRLLTNGCQQVHNRFGKPRLTVRAQIRIQSKMFGKKMLAKVADVVVETLMNAGVKRVYGHGED